MWIKMKQIQTGVILHLNFWKQNFFFFARMQDMKTWKQNKKLKSYKKKS